VRIGGSTAGTTVIWGDYGIRMVDKGRRISAAHLKIGEDTIRKRLRGMKFRLYTRVCANIGVYTSGNDQRMGKGKGSFDYWATRVAVSRVIFELSGDVHEQVVRDAMRLCGNKMPGKFTFIHPSHEEEPGNAHLLTETTQACTNLSKEGTHPSWGSQNWATVSQQRIY
jgi:ribosomal protein L16